jgi:hypothetical protein
MFTFGAITLSAAVLSACSSPEGAIPVLRTSGEAVNSAPLTSSAAGQTGTWATVALGNLNDPLNTFWQLFFLSASSSEWELATPPGVASNGGLVATVSPSGTVTAGFEPSLDLRFSPLAQSADQGATWAPGVLPGGLALVADSLAASSGHQELALLRSGGGEVVTSSGDLTNWTTVASTRGLAADNSTAGCGVEALTAVAFGAIGEDVVGAACAHGAEPGIFDLVNGNWRSVGPTLPDSTAGPSQVLRLVATPSGVTALASAGEGSARRLFALWSADGLKSWSVSAPLPLKGGSLTSTGVTPTGGLAVAIKSADGTRSAWVISSPGNQWQKLAPPPAGTSAVVATPSGGFDALIENQSTLEVDELGSGGWHRIQALAVPIQYGSSG